MIDSTGHVVGRVWRVSAIVEASEILIASLCLNSPCYEYYIGTTSPFSMDNESPKY